MANINGTELIGVKLDEYQGNPMLIFGSDKYPFKFGGTKAKHLLEAMKENGVQLILDAMLHLIGVNDPQWVQTYLGLPVAVIAEETVVQPVDLLANSPQLKGKPIIHEAENDAA